MRVLTDDDLKGLLSFEEMTDSIEKAYEEYSRGIGTMTPRLRMPHAGGILHLLAAEVPSLEAMGFKSAFVHPGNTKALTYLFARDTADLLAVINSRSLSLMRTAATSAIGTRLMARPESETAGVLGSGQQARAQLRALSVVIPLRKAFVWSPTLANRSRFAHELSEELRIDVSAVDEPEQAVTDSDVILTATKSTTPFLRDAWVRAGTHITAIGSDRPEKREVDSALLRRVDLVVVDGLEQAFQDSGDLLAAVQEGALVWGRVFELAALLGGRISGRENSDQVTLFAPVGAALGDIALAGIMLKKAEENGRGQIIRLGGRT